jgi:spore germination cell wall hydrolase CwlJ-like protein
MLLARAGLLLCSFWCNTAHVPAPEPVKLLCMAANIFFEARSEPLKGKLAVKDVTNNRGSNTCKVVFARKQFSWTHQQSWETIEKFLLDKPSLSGREAKAWKLAKQVAESRVVVLGPAYKHYHALSVNPPWTKPGVVIGNHKFMKGVR